MLCKNVFNNCESAENEIIYNGFEIKGERLQLSVIIKAYIKGLKFI